MKSGIIEGVARYCFALVGAITVAEASRIVMRPRNATAELLHGSDIRDKLLIGYTVVVFGQEPG